MRKKSRKEKVKFSSDFSLEERHAIIQEYLTGDLSKTALWHKYTGQRKEHGYIMNWMRQLGYINRELPKKGELAQVKTKLYPLHNKEFEKTRKELEAKVKELEDKLQLAEIKAEGNELMIDIAEKQFNIAIRKKLGTK